jgi:hypothetical protein
MLTSAALLLCASEPLSLYLDMLHQTGPLFSSDSPRAIEHPDAERMAQQHRKDMFIGAHRRLAKHHTA